MRRTLVLLVAATLVACGSDGSAPKSKHVLIIGVDGLRVDGLVAASTPALDGLIASGTVTYDGFAGGELGTATEQPTFSGPGWSSILTGVWVDKHGVTNNGLQGSRYNEYPHFFARVRQRDPDAYLSSFVSWPPINVILLESVEADEAFAPPVTTSAEADAVVTSAVLEHLEDRTPDVVFVHLDEVDHQGHVAGFSPIVPEYLEAVETVDAQIGQMLDAVRGRPSYEKEDWLILVTTDHGGLGQLHGGQSDEERTIFLIASGGSVRIGQTISPGPGHTAIPPTVMKHLGLSVDSVWGWESAPFGF
jgi:predicted AlkP superfamily pyrophosphatase or phosphodiesterase